MSTLQSLDRALDMLILINENGGNLSVSEIADIMDIHRSTVHRTLTTMYDKGFLSKNPNTGFYTIGSKSLMLNFSSINNLPIVNMARPYMAFLGEKYNHHVSLYVIEGTNVFVVTHYLGYFSTTFYSLYDNPLVCDAYRPSVTHCMLAFNCELNSSDTRIQTYLDKVSASTINKLDCYCDIDSFVSYLSEIKSRGYSRELGEFKLDEGCACFPIFNKDKVIATLNIHGQKSNINKNFKDEILSELRFMSKSLSELCSKEQ